MDHFFSQDFLNFFFASRRLKMLGDIANIVAYESLTNANLLQRIKEKPFFYNFFGYPYNSPIELKFIARNVLINAANLGVQTFAGGPAEKSAQELAGPSQTKCLLFR